MGNESQEEEGDQPRRSLLLPPPVSAQQVPAPRTCLTRCSAKAAYRPQCSDIPTPYSFHHILIQSLAAGTYLPSPSARLLHTWQGGGCAISAPVFTHLSVMMERVEKEDNDRGGRRLLPWVVVSAASGACRSTVPRCGMAGCKRYRILQRHRNMRQRQRTTARAVPVEEVVVGRSRRRALLGGHREGVACRRKWKDSVRHKAISSVHVS